MVLLAGVVGALALLAFSRRASAADDRLVTDDQGNAMPRGIRNNNPFNLTYSASIHWQGQAGADETGRYLVFDTAANGLRAGFRNLKNQQALHGLRTVRSIIGKYAPPNENDTAAYIADVAAQLNVGPDESLDLVNNPAQLQAFGYAVIWHENGMQPYSAAQLAAAVRAAQ